MARKSTTPAWPASTAPEAIRAHLDACREVAMAAFERSWGTRDVRKVAAALGRTIPGSCSPGDAAAAARRLLAGGDGP